MKRLWYRLYDDILFQVEGWFSNIVEVINNHRGNFEEKHWDLIKATKEEHSSCN